MPFGPSANKNAESPGRDEEGCRLLPGTWAGNATESSELWGIALAYNLVRLEVAHVAKSAKVEPKHQALHSSITPSQARDPVP